MAAKSSKSQRLSAPDSGVTVRMYYPRGLGDCFLLAFRGTDGEPRYMLIDCGVHQSTEDGPEKIRAVVRDIGQATGSHLHVVVATHQHKDHLSGFDHAREIFDDIQIDYLWLAWTEDETDATAKALRERYKKQLTALNAVHSRLTLEGHPLAEALDDLLGFEFSAADETGPLDFLREKSSQTPPPYLSPDTRPFPMPEVDGVRVYVLGPPKDPGLIARLRPRKGEAYEEPLALDELSGFFVAALAADGADNLPEDEREMYLRSYPFDQACRISIEEVASEEPEHAYGPFFRAHYGFGPPEEGQGDDWRRIDTDWLTSAGQLALHLNNYTNNTSLVLALELTESGRVLLFAADAQVGNWLSWQEVAWPDDGGAPGAVTGPDLLRRTVLYKVGHHGSHNATLSALGLEMMSDDLVAMIPVDEDWALKRRPYPWKMPYEPLREALEEKTRGRILRSDSGVAGAKPALLTASEWQSFLDNVEAHDEGLWVQYTVADS